MRITTILSPIFLVAGMVVCAQVSVNTDGSQADPSAIFDAKSTGKGILIPRMTTAQIGSIASPANGLQVFNTDNGKLYIYIAMDLIWKEVSYGTGTIAPPFLCGNPFNDIRDGKIYNTVLIGTQCWMEQNLNVGTRINASVNQTNNGIIEKYCNFDDDAICTLFGGLYQWDEFMNYSSSSNSNPSGRQGICPAGWHVPGDAEWCQLEIFLDPTVTCTATSWRGTDAGGKMKETGTTNWSSPNTGATNASGFTSLPGGYRLPGGILDGLSVSADYWSATEGSSSMSWNRFQGNHNAESGRSSSSKAYGFSGRCIKN